MSRFQFLISALYFFVGEIKMITKDELRNLLNLAAEFLKSKGISEEIILDVIKGMQDYAVRSGTYKEEI